VGDRDPIGPMGAQDGLDDETVRRVLVAATDVLASEGPSRTTLKWVAREAGVPTEVVAAHWPHVADLLGDVLDDLADRIEAEAPQLPGSGEDTDSALGDLIGLFARILARAILDGFETAVLQSRFPILERLLKYGADLGLDERTARYRVCQFLVLEWGWRLFGDHLAVACGLTDEPPGRGLDELRELERSLVTLPPVRPL
jgi:TetR/AcrR family transcriptional regulator, repressor for neighboring sulfatase